MSIHELPLILFGGIGADESLFRFQQLDFPNLVTPSWIEPRRAETLESYGARIAKEIDPGGPCFVGGASFGGMIALEAARHLQSECCLVISGVRSGRELPWKYRWISPLTKLVPGICTDAAGWATRLVVTASRWFGAENPVSPLGPIAGDRGVLLRWAGVAALRWRPAPFPFRIAQIHGENDNIFPINRVTPDVVAENGGHLLPLTHPEEVNEFLENAMRMSRKTA